MNLWYSILTSLNNLRVNKLRSILTMLGVTFAVLAEQEEKISINSRDHEQTLYAAEAAVVAVAAVAEQQPRVAAVAGMALLAVDGGIDVVRGEAVAVADQEPRVGVGAVTALSRPRKVTARYF